MGGGEGAGVVTMGRYRYSNCTEVQLLGDLYTYIKLKQDPTAEFQNNLRSLLQNGLMSGIFSQTLNRQARCLTQK